jgi:hypothetical protein
MQSYLAKRDPWFVNLENFRHSLGHRIPLYIPPYVVSARNSVSYEKLEAQMNDALFQQRDLGAYAHLKAEQDALRRFEPLMKHSFGDPTPPVIFHSQILADFATLEEIIQSPSGIILSFDTAFGA